MIAYKGFDKDLSCTSSGNRFQYKLNQWNEEPEANCVKNGFHCAENPLDCLSYYPRWNESVYYVVLADGDIDEDGTDSKIACTRMRLVKQLTLEEFIYMSLTYMVNHPHRKNANCVSNDIDIKEGLRSGFKIVRGKNPKASGNIGTIIGFAKEEVDSVEIEEISIITIDDEKFMSDVIYCVNGQESNGGII